MPIFDQLVQQALNEAADRLLSYAARAVKKELAEQGHRLTGSLERTTRIDIQSAPDQITGRVVMNEYFAYLERSLPANRVPYRRGSGAKRSKVVEALERYWKLRGLAPKEARSATFATLNKWKQEGRPTRASFRFSKNGRRTGFLEAAINDITGNAQDILLGEATNEIEKALAKAIRTAIRSGA
jgi:hypothetical protein